MSFFATLIGSVGEPIGPAAGLAADQEHLVVSQCRLSSMRFDGGPVQGPS